ncbi:WD repeat-containing protein [Trifolium repens]|nr:WD repeat-containing protein [Trifolium repens]
MWMLQGLQLSICGSLFNSIDAILKLDEDRIITGSENGMINMVGILLNRIIQPIAEHSEYPVECLGNILLLFSQNLMWLFWSKSGTYSSEPTVGILPNHSANSMFITINNLWDLDNILQGSRSTATSETGVVDNEVDSDDDDEMDM